MTGSADAERRTARGRACASSAALLDDVRLASSRDGDVLVLRTEMPAAGLFFRYAHLDLVVVLPGTLPVEIEDGSGDVEIHGVGGRLEVVRDGSGDMRLTGVGGSVEVLRDGSGDILVIDVGGSVRIGSDTSGGIRIEDVRGDVRIDENGSGDVDVRRAGGDFILLRDGSGSVFYAEVAGAVDVP